VTGSKRKNAQGMDSCQWTASGKFSLTVGYSNTGLSGLAAAQGAAKVDVGKHEAVQALDKFGDGCGVLIGATEKATVIVAATNLSGPSADACPHAVSAAKIIDPKLP
jgi:hypothetical protein